MDFLPHLRVTEHPIGSPPASACPTGNYIASRLPFLEDATANAVPPLSPPPTPLPVPPPPSLASQHDRIPRACHGVERRQRSRPSSRGGADYLHFSKLTRDERAALKTAPSRRVAFAEHAHQIASSSLWSSPDDALQAAPVFATATASEKLKRRPPTPGRATSFFDAACASFGDGDDERDASPGFDADVEFEPAAEVARGGSEQVGDKERLTIIVPGGKSEAYVAMAFERSCSLGADDDDGADVGDGDRHAGAVHHHDISTNEKTGLKIRIPVPNPLFMLSLRLASSCRVSDKEGYSGADDEDDEDRDRDRDHQNLNPMLRVVRQVRSASSRSPTPPVAPPPTPAPPQGRAERRAARRGALAPYCAIGRVHVARAVERPCLTY